MNYILALSLKRTKINIFKIKNVSELIIKI
jgi:hypothetical protein